MSIRKIVISTAGIIIISFAVTGTIFAFTKPEYFKAREVVIVSIHPHTRTSVGAKNGEGRNSTLSPPAAPLLAAQILRTTSTQDLSTQSLAELPVAIIPTSTVPKVIFYGTDEVRGIYATVWSFASASMRKYFLRLFDSSELKLNTLVINVKDDDGYILFKQIKNIKPLLDEFHKRNIRLIGRIVVFKDAQYTLAHPEAALKIKDLTQDNTSTSTTANPENTQTQPQIWRDVKGSAWINPSDKQYWEYINELSAEAITQGFDELQYDYFRFPSEGNLAAIDYDPQSTALVNFAAYLRDTIASRVPISIDIFAQTLIDQKSNLGIGQNYPALEPYFDYISPMIYPSHYAPGNFGFKNPAEHPTEVVSGTLRYVAPATRKKIRPWLQAFNLGALYTKDTIYAEINSAEEFDINGWILWNPENVYSI